MCNSRTSVNDLSGKVNRNRCQIDIGGGNFSTRVSKAQLICKGNPVRLISLVPLLSPLLRQRWKKKSSSLYTRAYEILCDIRIKGVFKGADFCRKTTSGSEMVSLCPTSLFFGTETSNKANAFPLIGSSEISERFFSILVYNVRVYERGRSDGEMELNEANNTVAFGRGRSFNLFLGISVYSRELGSSINEANKPAKILIIHRCQVFVEA